MRQLPLGIRLRDAATFANFVVGANAEALRHLRTWETTATGRGIYLWGVQGSGKTHLLQAVCHAASADGETAAYIPLNDIAELDPTCLEGLETMHCVCLDDVHAIAGDPAWEAGVFHLYNRVVSTGGRLLVAAARAPAHLGIVMPDLATRLGWGLALRLEVLTDEEKSAALQQRGVQRGLELGPQVADYLLRHCSRDMTDLFQLLDELDRASLAAQRRLTIPFVKETLSALKAVKRET